MRPSSATRQGSVVLLAFVLLAGCVAPPASDDAGEDTEPDADLLAFY